MVSLGWPLAAGRWRVLRVGAETTRYSYETVIEETGLTQCNDIDKAVLKGDGRWELKLSRNELENKLDDDRRVESTELSMIHLPVRALVSSLLVDTNLLAQAVLWIQ
jgi:hypothetical protein